MPKTKDYTIERIPAGNTFVHHVCFKKDLLTLTDHLVKESLQECMSGEVRAVFFDVREVQRSDARAMAALAKEKVSLAKRERDLVVICNRKIEDLLRATHLLDMMKTARDEKEAISMIT